jgi:hypothetical protein
MVFLEYNRYPCEEASLWVVGLGQASKEGVVVVEIVPPQPVSALVQCTPTDDRVAAYAAHG